MRLLCNLLGFFFAMAVLPNLEVVGIQVEVPILGTIEGKEINTIGNLNNPRKTYFTFRNIPYAEPPIGEKRFSVSKYNLEFTYSKVLF